MDIWYKLEYPDEQLLILRGFIQNIGQEEVKSIETWPMDSEKRTKTDGWLYYAK